MSGTRILPPLFERLASSAEEAQGAAAFDRDALADSVRTELLHLLNTRRSAPAMTTQPSILDYGIADWTALQGQRGDDRRQLAREIRTAIQHFEPRLQLTDVEVVPVAGQPQRLRVHLCGALRGGGKRWPAAFVIENSGDGLEVRHERLD